MCTVTFVKHGQSVIITSNRDEQVGRKPALPPAPYDFRGKMLYFPKDGLAGGTWYVADEAGNVAVLLNGAAEKHEFRTDWRKSRGLVLLELFGEDNPREAWDAYDFSGIEPFTLVLFANGALHQLRWDSRATERVDLPVNVPHIWSSSPLYEAEVRQWRQERFLQHLGGIADPDHILDFHRSESPDAGKSIVIDRGFLKTLSITQTVMDSEALTMRHIDLRDGAEHALSFTLHG